MVINIQTSYNDTANSIEVSWEYDNLLGATGIHHRIEYLPLATLNEYYSRYPNKVGNGFPRRGRKTLRSKTREHSFDILDGRVYVTIPAEEDMAFRICEDSVMWNRRKWVYDTFVLSDLQPEPAPDNQPEIPENAIVKDRLCPYGGNQLFYVGCRDEDDRWTDWGLLFVETNNEILDPIDVTVEPGVTYESGPAGYTRRFVFHKDGKSLVYNVSIHEGTEPGDNYKPTKEHPNWKHLNREISGLRMRQNGTFARRINTELPSPTNFRSEHVPGKWIFRWDWTGDYSEIDHVRIWLKPSDERGLARTWYGALRNSSGNGDPAGPWVCDFPGALVEGSEIDGQWSQTNFLVGTIFDAILEPCSKYQGSAAPTKPIAVRTTQPSLRLSDGDGISLSLGSSRLFEPFNPLTDNELLIITGNLQTEINNLSIRASRSAMIISANDIGTLLHEAGAGKLSFFPLDQEYTAVEESILLEFLNDDKTNHVSYVAGSWDCDNFATELCSEASKVIGNCCGIVVDYSGGHAYNVFVVHNDQVAKLVFVEPQSDQIVVKGDTLSTAEAYKMEEGYIHWP